MQGKVRTEYQNGKYYGYIEFMTNDKRYVCCRVSGKFKNHDACEDYCKDLASEMGILINPLVFRQMYICWDMDFHGSKNNYTGD